MGCVQKRSAVVSQGWRRGGRAPVKGAARATDASALALPQRVAPPTGAASTRASSPTQPVQHHLCDGLPPTATAIHHYSTRRPLRPALSTMVSSAMPLPAPAPAPAPANAPSVDRTGRRQLVQALAAVRKLQPRLALPPLRLQTRHSVAVSSPWLSHYVANQAFGQPAHYALAPVACEGPRKPVPPLDLFRSQ